MIEAPGWWFGENHREQGRGQSAGGIGGHPIGTPYTTAKMPRAVVGWGLVRSQGWARRGSTAAIIRVMKKTSRCSLAGQPVVKRLGQGPQQAGLGRGRYPDPLPRRRYAVETEEEAFASRKRFLYTCRRDL